MAVIDSVDNNNKMEGDVTTEYVFNPLYCDYCTYYRDGKCHFEFYNNEDGKLIMCRFQQAFYEVQKLNKELDRLTEIKANLEKQLRDICKTINSINNMFTTSRYLATLMESINKNSPDELKFNDIENEVNVRRK